LVRTPYNPYALFAPCGHHEKNAALNCRANAEIAFLSFDDFALKPELGIADAAGWFRQAARKLHARILPVRLDHIAALERLPVRHRDPFDRSADYAGGRRPVRTHRMRRCHYPDVTCIWD
jgi:hypothetical protein